MSPHPLLVAVLALPAAAASQSVGIELAALAPLEVKVTEGGAIFTSTLPVGLLPNNGTLVVGAPSAPMGTAGALWFSSTGSTVATVRLMHQVTSSGSPGFGGHAGPHEFLVAFTSAIPRNAALQLERHTNLAPGAPWPIVDVDLGNDGSIDIAGLPASAPAVFSVSFGPQPLHVRLVIDTLLVAQPFSFNAVWLTLLPDNHLTLVPMVSACYTVAPPPPPFLQPSFDDLGVLLTQQLSAPSVVVVGLSVAPVLLPTFASGPCLLLPAPDIVVLLPGTLHVPLPHSLRPLTFAVQEVTPTPYGLWSSDGYVVTAY